MYNYMYNYTKLCIINIIMYNYACYAYPWRFCFLVKPGLVPRREPEPVNSKRSGVGPVFMLNAGGAPYNSSGVSGLVNRSTTGETREEIFIIITNYVTTVSQPSSRLWLLW